MPRLFAVILAVECLFLPSFAELAAADEPDIGAVTALRGPVWLKRLGRDRDIVVQKGTAVRVGDIVETGKDGSCQVALIDESFYELGEGSSVRVNQYAFSEKENRRTAVAQVMEGQARFVIFRPRSGGSRFRVETGTAAIDPDRLADFVVKTGPHSTDVMVLQKGLRVRNRSSLYVGEYRIGENQKTTVGKNKPPTPPVSITQEERREVLKQFRGR